MTTTTEPPASTLVFESNSPAENCTVADFQKALEKGTDEEKISAMKTILITMLDGNLMTELLMHIIRFVMPTKNKRLKKLSYFYWEIFPKLDAEGNLRHEMILVCNAIQHDLQHPNEYLRGNTLRFLTKLKEPELLEQMVPSVLACLEYRHAYVRKYAILAILSIYKVSSHLLPDAKDIIYSFLVAETDPICKRNAFIGLTELYRQSALQYLEENISELENLDPLLQTAFVQFIKKDASLNTALKTQYIELLLEFLSSTNSNEVVLEAALALTAITSNATVLVKTVTKLIDLIVKVSDNNIKLIVLDRIQEINESNPGALEDLALELLRVLNAEDIDVRAKALEISLDLVTPRNVEDVVQLLKKELQTTVQGVDMDNSMAYKQLLIKTIRSIAVRFVEMASNVVSLLLDFIGELNSVAASGVIAFLREVIEKYPQFRSNILKSLLESLNNVKSAKAYRGALWIIGEYAEDEHEIQQCWKHIRGSVGELPILQSELKKMTKVQEEPEEETDLIETSNKPTGPIILPDGTYAPESAFDDKHSSKSVSAEERDARPPLRRFILNGDFYTASILASTLVKLVLKFEEVCKKRSVINASKAEALLMLVSIIRVGQSSLVERKIDEDSLERIVNVISILMDETDPKERSSESKLFKYVFLDATKSSFKNQMSVLKKQAMKRTSKDETKNTEPVDKAIQFRQFSNDDNTSGKGDSIEEDLQIAIKGEPIKNDSVSTISKLKKIVPLTGFSDSIYAEACITNHQFDVVLDVLLVNQTKETLKNLHVQFATLGDLKIIETPAKTNMVPHGFHKFTVVIKVSSADTGVIFGNIIYDGAHGEDAKYVILNDVQVDMMDYIKPSQTNDESFRTMWNAFEWENKISVKSNLGSLQTYLDELVQGTNMNVLTSVDSLKDKDCRFLSCNLYAKSSFGEDALANLCIEQDPKSNQIIGYVRIRAKGQGLALSLGDRVALIAREHNRVKISHV